MAKSRYEQDGPRVLSTRGRGETFADIMTRRLNRRNFLKGSAAASTVVVAGQVIGRVGVNAQGTPEAGRTGVQDLAFEAIAPSSANETMVAPGYRAVPFLRWGDPLTSDLGAFDPANISAEDQANRIGYNHDFVGFLPLPLGSDRSDHGLLVINHEYTNPELMFSNYLILNPELTATNEGATPLPGMSDEPELVPDPTAAIVDVELAAHGISIVEIQRNESGEWETVLDSEYNRRLTATSPMQITGPAAGVDLLTTSADATGTEVTGTLNNCAGGLTPWGTYVSCEENFHQYFGNLNALPEDDPVRELHDRYGVPEESSERLWENFIDRFDIAKEPNEPFRFGWAVEVDPYEPTFTPKKRTALGRFKHEAVNLVVAPGGEVVVYSGDDERFEYIYKFVTADGYNPDDRAANMDLLDDGTLYVAQLNEDGSGEWLPLVHGEGPLTAGNGFEDQAMVLINPRAAADLLGATKMDRPEDMEQNPVTGRVYSVMTNNTNRGTEEGEEGITAANPRAENVFGHIIELTETDDNPAATSFAWDIFMLCGEPSDESTYFAGFPKDQVSPIANPDNITFDMEGNLWISTDGQPRTLDVNDGLFAVPTAGPNRGYLRQFFSAVPGAEVSGPMFTPDNTTLFMSIQHPGEGGTFDQPLSSWPEASGPPRPALVVVQAENGGPIGAASE